MPYKRFECALCCEYKFEEMPRWVGPVGGSRICNACARDGVVPQFHAALEHEYQYPPMWGKEKLDIWTFWDLFDDDFREAWPKKVKEYAMPVKERVYCEHRDSRSGNVCGVFLGQKRVGVMWCNRSRCHTCMNCGSRDDSSGVMSIWNHVCKTAATGDGLENFRKEQDYQQCPDCEKKIFLGEGCNHMTCRPPCSAHFCFICGERVAAHHSGHWQQGGCPRFGVSGPRRIWDQPGEHSEDEDDGPDSDDDEHERDIMRVFALMDTFAAAVRFERTRIMFMMPGTTADSERHIAFYVDVLANLEIVRQILQSRIDVDRISLQLREFSGRHQRIRREYDLNRNNADWLTGPRPVTRLADLDDEFDAYFVFALETMADMEAIAAARGRMP